MTSAQLVSAIPRLDTVHTYVSRRRRIERLCYLVGAVLVCSGIFHLGVLVVGGETWQGPVSFRKPATFGVSFGLTLITIAWASSYLRISPRARAWLLGIFAADCVLEVGGITVQAWRYVPSHFNTETPFDTVVAMSLAFGGGVLIVVLGRLAVTAFAGRVDAPADLRLALQAGFALMMVGLATGAAMIAKGEILIKSGHRQQAYDHAGSLKYMHGVTLHAILVLPAVALLLAERGWDLERRRRAVVLATALYVVAAAGVALLAVL